jgi:hypothetical protein
VPKLGTGPRQEWLETEPRWSAEAGPSAQRWATLRKKWIGESCEKNHVPHSSWLCLIEYACDRWTQASPCSSKWLKLVKRLVKTHEASENVRCPQEGLLVGVGALETLDEGAREGATVGPRVGRSEGLRVGPREGKVEGYSVGRVVGYGVGRAGQDRTRGSIDPAISFSAPHDDEPGRYTKGFSFMFMIALDRQQATHLLGAG